jgi:hypothetical protein
VCWDSLAAFNACTVPLHSPAAKEYSIVVFSDTGTSKSLN